ncbi:class I SAM-dependent methyltransferase [Agrococcus versicolor]|uniref:Class I SAM-dependent methyltransferase n=1 Tax=Agrococcus versicolor TaxID=501482 RepID=A0ABP5MPT7_9MICO
MSDFGEGGQAPYERALSTGSSAMLQLREVAGARPGMTSLIDVARFTASADDVDLAILERGDGAVIDLGCGPGRMVRAAIASGRHALGIDVSSSAVELARSDGLPVLQASLFDPLPDEGAWGQALLLDGNLGIGGDVVALVRRATALVRVGGVVVIETHPRRRRSRQFDAVLVDQHGGRSETFPWAEMGCDALVGALRAAGVDVSGQWTLRGRTFVEIVRG